MIVQTPLPVGPARAFRLVVVLGAAGMGKSSLVAAWIEEARAKGRDVRALDPSQAWPGLGEWPDGGPKDERDPAERAEAWIRALRRDRWGRTPPPCLLILDDADTYLDGGKARGIWRDLLANFRHWRCDVVLIARRTQDLPKAALMQAHRAYLFNGTDRALDLRACTYLGIGDGTVRAIPREPFRYLEVECSSGLFREGRTHARAVRTRADL